MYGFSRGFSAKSERQASDWQRWQIVETENAEQLEKVLEGGGYEIEHGY